MKKIFMERPSVATTCSNTPSRTAARGGNKKYARDRGDEGGRFLRARVPRVSIQLYAPPRPPGAFSAGDAPFPAAAAVVVVVVVSAPPTPNTTSSSSIRARLSTSFCLSVKNFPFRSASKALSAASCPAVSACPRSRALAARSNAFLGVGGVGGGVGVARAPLRAGVNPPNPSGVTSAGNVAGVFAGAAYAASWDPALPVEGVQHGYFWPPPPATSSAGGERRRGRARGRAAETFRALLLHRARQRALLRERENFPV